MSARWDLAVRIDSYRQSLRAALDIARQQQFRVLQAGTVGSDLSPREFGQSARRHLVRHLSSLGLRLDCLTVDFSGDGLCEVDRAEPRLRHLTDTLKLCRDLGISRAAVRCGGLNAADTEPHVIQVLAEIAERADRHGIDVAVDAAGGTPMEAAEVVARLRCPRLGVALDSASLAGSGSTVELPRGGLLAVSLRDARRSGNVIEEQEFGAGEVPFDGLLRALSEAGYEQTLAIRRDSARDPIDALRRGGEYVRLLLERGQA